MVCNTMDVGGKYGVRYYGCVRQVWCMILWMLDV